MAASAFLNLPLEIRCLIYSFYFPARIVDLNDNHLYSQPHTQRNAWRMLLTCRLVKREAQPIMYKSTVYQFDTSRALNTPTVGRALVALHELRCIRLKIEFPECAGADRYNRRMPKPMVLLCNCWRKGKTGS